MANWSFGTGLYPLGSDRKLTFSSTEDGPAFSWTIGEGESEEPEEKSEEENEPAEDETPPTEGFHERIHRRVVANGFSSVEQFASYYGLETLEAIANHLSLDRD